MSCISSHPIKDEDTTKDKEDKIYRDVTSTFLSGQAKDCRGSCTIIIPKKIAEKYDIYKPSPVLVEGTDNGILIRKIAI
jgi:hypothetical protein